MKKQYNIGDVMIAISKFKINDLRGKVFWYDVGDKFYIMNIRETFTYIEFDINSHNSIFKWFFQLNELNKLKDYIVHKKDFVKVIRKQKINKLKSRYER